MAKEKMTEAEKYRLERKKRIEKEKKKKNSYINRNRQKVEKAEKTLGIIVGIAVVVAVICLLLSYFGVFNRLFTAAKVDGKSVSIAEMNCAFADVKNQVYNASQEYESSYGSGYYTADTKSTDECAYDSTKTWGEYFEEQALEHVKQIYTFKDAEGNTLTEDQQKEIADTFTSLASSAKENNFSLNAYIREAYGVGVNKTVLREWLENIYKAQNAQEAVQSTYEDKITDKDIKAYFEEHKADYTVKVDTTSVADKLEKEDISNDEVDKLIAKAVAAAKKDASSIYTKVKANPSSMLKTVNAYEKKAKGDAATAYTEDTLAMTGVISSRMSSLGADAQKWIANSKTVNQTGLVYSADYENKSFQFDVIVVTTPAKVYSTVNVRHILIKPENTESDDSWKAAKEEIETIYAQWKKKGTEDYFATLATEKTEDTGSQENGGLYENVTPGQMVDTFDAWCFDASRKAGDTGIVKTTYGYHVMYFVSNNGAYWKTQVPTDMSNEYLNTNVTEKLEAVKTEKVSLGWNAVKEVKNYKADQKTTTTTTTEVTTTAAAQ